MSQPSKNIGSEGPPDDLALQAISIIQETLYEAAKLIEEETTPSREQSVAFTKLDEAWMWAAQAVRTDQLKREGFRSSRLTNDPVKITKSTS